MPKRSFPSRERIIDSPAPEGYEQILLIDVGVRKEGCTLNGVEIQKAKTSANDVCIVWACFDDGPYKGKAVSCDFSLHPDSLWKLKDAMRALGVIDDIPENADFDLEDEDTIERLSGAKGIPVFFTDNYKNELKSKLDTPSFLLSDEVDTFVPKVRSATPQQANAVSGSQPNDEF